MNHQHEIGMDLEGDLGGLFFNDVNDLAVQRSRVVANANNQLPRDGQLAVEITDSTKLPAGSWTLQFSGDGRSFELIDKESGKVVNQGRLPDPVQSEISMPGFNIRIEGGTFNAGDKYLIQPSRNAAESIGLQVSREEDLAFASPIRATSGDQNTGTGEIDQGAMLNVRNPFTGSLLPGFQSAGELANGPLTIKFQPDPNDPSALTFTVTGPPPSNTVVGTPNQPYDPGKINTVFSGDPADGDDYQGFQFKLKGKPGVGDTFEIGYNKNGISDNRNAELLASLGTANTMNGGTQSFTEGYAGVVEAVGVKTRQSQFDLEAGKTLLAQSSAQRESVSGVNLDEEAGKLIQYQAGYNASAQVISVAQDLFNTLLQTFR